VGEAKGKRSMYAMTAGRTLFSGKGSAPHVGLGIRKYMRAYP
jgi:hypothetical protein